MATRMWRQPNYQLLPWMGSLSKRIGSLVLPNLAGPNLWVSSNYVFGSSNSKFDVIAVLLASPEESCDWESKRQLVRKEILGLERRMSFKALGDHVRQRSFIPFLQAADTIHGVVVSVALDKSLSRHFIFGPDEIEASTQRGRLVAKWKKTQFDRMVTAAHFVAFLIAGTSSAGQDILWISDQDDSFANEEFSQDTCRIFTKFLDLYSAHEYGSISIGTTAIAEPDLLEEDLAAIADIAAGGTAELLTHIRNDWGCVPGIAIELSELPTRTQLFFDWFTCKATTLKKVGCLFEQVDSALRVSTWT